MYLLYLDEAGNESDPNDRYFVLGGIAVFERVTFFLSQQLDRLQKTNFPDAPPLEFHASAIRAGRGFWRAVPNEHRQRLLREIVEVIANAHRPGIVLFAAAIEKSDQLHGENAVAQATEQILSRFDYFLRRRAGQGDRQRGLVVFAEGRFHKRARLWVRDFRQLGTQWGVLKNLCDIPYFAGARETRLLQLADFVAHSVFLLYERRDPALIKPFIHRFDQKGGTIHGLRHFRNPAAPGPCQCPACFNWKNPGAYGPWLEPPGTPPTSSPA